MDCPICMDVIEMNKNCITTECGHCFHASCLMTSIAHNGFGCPYCRTAMAEVRNARGHHNVIDYDEDDEDNDDMFQDDEDEMFDNYALRGFRFFWNNINEEEIDEEDEADEEQEDEWADFEQQDPPQDENVPTPQYVADKLKRQGVTYDELVHLLLYKDHDEYDVDDNDAVDRLDGQVFGKIRVIVSNYTPEAPAQQPAPEPIQVQVQAVDFEAQSKSSSRGPMTIEELL